MNFFRKRFGEMAISQTFRDLESFQLEMGVDEHKLLHQLYTGIKVPNPALMLERIEEEQALGNMLKVKSSSTNQYELSNIENSTLEELKREYNALSLGKLATKKIFV